MKGTAEVSFRSIPKAVRHHVSEHILTRYSLEVLHQAPFCQGQGNKQHCCLPQDIYAEWVGAEAKLALLEAHAQCRAFAAGLPDESTRTSVVNAQEPHARSAGYCRTHTTHLVLRTKVPECADKLRAWTPRKYTLANAASDVGQHVRI